jgi:hypothetical protein
MSETQFDVLVSVPLVGILLSGGLFIFIGSRVDALIKIVGELQSSVAVLEHRHGR